MPMIDVYAESALFPKESRKALGLDLTKAVLRAEGVAQPGMFHLRNTTAFLHLMEEGTVVVSGRRDEEVQKLAREIRKQGAEVEFLGAELPAPDLCGANPQRLHAVIPRSAVPEV